MRKSIFLALGLLPVLASAQVSQTKAGYVFRAKFVKGQSVFYGMTAEQLKTPAQIKASGPKVSITSSLALAVLSVEKGVASVKATQGAVMMGGHVFQKGASEEALLDQRMRPIGTTDPTIGPFSGMYQERAIKLGETWSAPIQLSTGMMTGNMLVSYKLSKFAVVNGNRVAVLDTKLTGKLAGHGQTLVRVSDGIPQSMNIDLDMIYNPGTGPKADTAMRLHFGFQRK
jgi:hypothetical protein